MAVERWKNRIIERVDMRVGDLRDHEGNPWLHPARQQEQVEGLLNEIGKIDSIKAWRSERLNGVLATWDGHLRKALNPDEIWPVDITDLTDEEADLVIAVYNRTSHDAMIEGDLLDALLDGVAATDMAVLQMLDEMSSESEMTKLADPTGAGYGDAPRLTGDSRHQIRAVLYVDDIEIFESALLRTGLVNRGEAILEICQFYLDTHGE
jgi:hypothetical protein